MIGESFGEQSFAELGKILFGDDALLFSRHRPWNVTMFDRHHHENGTADVRRQTRVIGRFFV